MNRVGGVLAACDGEDCTATHQIHKDTDTRWALEWAGWEMTGDLVFCPKHRTVQPALFD